MGFLSNALRPDGVSITAFAAPATCTMGDNGFGVDPLPAVRVVQQAEAASLCADGSALIADARSAEAFAKGHVTGAIHLPCSASEQVAAAAESVLSGKRFLLVYGDRTDDAFPVAEQMRQRLARKDLIIGVLEGGFEAWSEAGLACSSGTCPACTASEHTRHAEEHGH